MWLWGCLIRRTSDRGGLCPGIWWNCSLRGAARSPHTDARRGQAHGHRGVAEDRQQLDGEGTCGERLLTLGAGELLLVHGELQQLGEQRRQDGGERSEEHTSELQSRGH